MLKMFNFKWDMRTARNIAVFPISILIRAPLVICYWGIEWLHDNMGYWVDKLPGWKQY
jgi:hypothetical protein